jgi:hypothetical protein
VANVALDPQQLERVTSSMAKAVTPSDTVDLPELASAGLYVIVAGNVSFLNRDGETINLLAVPAFTRIPIVVKRVRATGTAATVLALS